MTRLLAAVVSSVLVCGLIQPFAPAQRAAEPKGPPSKVEAIPTATSAWQLAWTDLEGDGAEEILYASYSGRLTCQQLKDGKVRWSCDLGGFPLVLRTFDLDGDGRREVLAASAAGSLHVLDAAGKELWKWGDGFLYYGLAAGRLLDKDAIHVAVGGDDNLVSILDTRGKLVKQIPFPHGAGPRHSIRHLDAADIDGDGLDEMVVANHNQRFALLDPRIGKYPWWKALEPFTLICDAGFVKWQAKGPAGLMVTSKRHVALVEPSTGNVRWLKQTSTGDHGCRMAFFSPIDLDGDGQREMAILNDRSLVVLDAQGEEKYRAETSSYSFNCLAKSPRAESAQVLLGSVTGADRNIYRIAFGKSARDQFHAFDEPPGHREKINDNLRALRRLVLAAPADEATPQRDFVLGMGAGSPDKENIDQWAQQQKRWRDSYPYPNIHFSTVVGVVEAGLEKAGAQGAVRSTEAILEMAEACEKENLQHVLVIAHGHNNHMKLSTVEGWLERTPKSCQGLISSELNIQLGFYKGLGAAPKFAPILHDHLDNYLQPCVDAARKRGKPTYLMMKRGFWTIAPALLSTRLFAPERAEWLVAETEESLSTTPEQNQMAQVGLWRSGLVREWATNVIPDQLRAGETFEFVHCDPDRLLRHLVMGAACGARQHRVARMYFLAFDRRDRYDLKVGDGFRYTPFGQLSLDLFIHLLGKGLIDVPQRENIVGLSPVVWRFTEPSQTYLGANLGIRKTDQVEKESLEGLFGGGERPYSPTRETYAPRYLSNVRQHAHAYIPETPYGLPVIVPDWHQSKHWPGETKFWRSDGIDLIVDGEKRSAAAMRPALLESFQKAAESLPVRAANCFCMATQRKDGTLRVTLIDPAYLEPVERKVRLTTQRPIAALRDVVAGKSLAFKGREAEIDIPAGTFRIIDVKLAAAED